MARGTSAVTLASLAVVLNRSDHISASPSLPRENALAYPATRPYIAATASVTLLDIVTPPNCRNWHRPMLIVGLLCRVTPPLRRVDRGAPIGPHPPHPHLGQPGGGEAVSS